MKSALPVIYLALVVYLAPNLAIAGESRLSVSAIVENANYESTEYRFGSVFNRESGIISGPEFQFEYRQKAWRIGASIRDLSGLIEYDGQNQIGIPIQSQTDLEYSQHDLSAIYQFQTAVPVELGVVYRTRKIDRNIRPTFITQGLHETLRQTEWGPDLGIFWQASRRFNISANVKALITTESTLTVDFLGTYDSGVLRMPNNWDHEIEVSADYLINENATIKATLIHQQFDPTSSDSAPLTQNGAVVGSYNYPGSRQEIWFYGIGLLLSW